MRCLIWLLAALAAPVLPAATYHVIVAGLGGEPDYEQRFNEWAQEAEKILSANGARNLVMLSGKASTKEALRKHLEELARQTAAEDAVAVLLIGHGTYDGHDYRFNLPGPDISAAELAALMNAIPAGRQLIINATSASGAALPLLARPGRVVITATKSGTEKNATVFARYWIEALRDPAADTDKNETVSALEAYRYSARKTANFYESQKRLATEHAMLDDIGDGAGVRDPAPDNGHGMLSSGFVITRFGLAQQAAVDPARRKLYERKEQLEQEIGRVKYQKAALPAEEYRKVMTALLLELAKTQEALEKRP